MLCKVPNFLGKSTIEHKRNVNNFACVASVSVRFRSKERGTRVSQRPCEKMTQVRSKGFGSRFISRAVKTENPLPRSFFAPKLNGNACYAG